MVSAKAPVAKETVRLAVVAVTPNVVPIDGTTAWVMYSRPKAARPAASMPDARRRSAGPSA